MFYNLIKPSVLNIFMTGLYLGAIQLNLSLIIMEKISSEILWYFTLLTTWISASILGTFYDKYAYVNFKSNSPKLNSIILVLTLILNIYLSLTFNQYSVSQALIIMGISLNGFYGGIFLSGQFRLNKNPNILLIENNGFIAGFILGYIFLFSSPASLNTVIISLNILLLYFRLVNV